MTNDDARRLLEMAEQAEAEAKAIKALIPSLVDAQWSKGRPPSRRRWEQGEPEDAGIRSKGTPPADPTGDAAVCPHRLRVRKELQTADRLLLPGLVHLRGVRTAMERALHNWEGDRDK